MKSQEEKAEEFRTLHNSKRILILPNAWDVPSARIFEEAGFPAIATSSATLAVSLGYPDGERIGKDEFFLAVKRIANHLTAPLTVDIESGFGTTRAQLSDTIKRVIEAGAIGINIEDISNFESKTLFAVEKQVERIRTARSASEALGFQLFINARTDAFRYTAGEDKVRLQETIRRANAYAEADADCLYPMGLTDSASLCTFVRTVDKPVNILARKGAPTIPELEKIGVKRLSLGPGPMEATLGFLRRIANELKEKGTYEILLAEAISFDELNALAEPRRS